jgi:hypothetical protein
VRVRGKVTRRSPAWLSRLAERGDRRAAVETPRGRLIEQVSEVELGGKLQAA